MLSASFEHLACHGSVAIIHIFTLSEDCFQTSESDRLQTSDSDVCSRSPKLHGQTTIVDVSDLNVNPLPSEDAYIRVKKIQSQIYLIFLRIYLVGLHIIDFRRQNLTFRVAERAERAN